ncbi:Hypothetical protein, putative, partial [Bodo saltans]
PSRTILNSASDSQSSTMPLSLSASESVTSPFTISITGTLSLSNSSSETMSLSTTRSHQTTQSFSVAASVTKTSSPSTSVVWSPSHSAASTRSSTEAPTNTSSVTLSELATVSAGSFSVTSSSSKATRTASSTRRTPSPTATMYCALVPADGTNSVGRLQRFNSTALVSVPIVGTVSASTFVSAASISRAVLLQNLPLGMNISVSFGGTIRGGPADGWALVSATMDVVAANAVVPLVTAEVPLTLLSANVVDRQQSFAVVLRPPNATGRWLPSSLSTFRPVSLVVTLVLRCPTDPTITVDVAVEIPCPGQEQPLAEEVKAASTAALYSTLIAGSAGGGAVGRVAAVRSLVLCSSDTVSGGRALTHFQSTDVTTPTLRRLMHGVPSLETLLAGLERVR